MLDNISTEFSISDLENLIGVKAHTIRIWEKRYNLLNPERDKNGVRVYSLPTLLKMLNVTFLLNRGFKISKIAAFSDEELFAMVREQVNKNVDEEYFQSRLHLCMMSFDSTLFDEIYAEMTKHYLFREIVYHVFFPFLQSIGLLWQTNTIKPSHEHFISQLIRQKILIQTEKVDVSTKINKEKVFVLYLPIGEIHDVKLLMLNFELKIKGYHVIYLGDNIDLDSVSPILTGYPNAHFITILTVGRPESYLQSLVYRSEEVLQQYNSRHELSVLVNWASEDFEDLEHVTIERDYHAFLDNIFKAKKTKHKLNGNTQKK